MIKKLLLFSVFSIYSFPYNVFAEDEISFIPRTWVGVANYSFKQDARLGVMPDGSNFPEVKFDVNFLMLGVGLTSVYKDFYLDFSYQGSSDESDYFNESGFSEKLTGDRTDYSATIGMRIFDNRGNVYVGYKNGKSDASGNSGTQLTFKEDGFFIGSSYGWIISDIGLLSVNIAYADLDGNLKEEPGPGYPSGLGMDADSEASGLSYGILWSSHLFNDIGYTLSIDANSYEFDHIKENSTTSLPDKIEEELITAKFSISYRF